MGITHSRTLAAGHAVAEGPQGVCGWRAGVCMSLARAWEADAMVCVLGHGGKCVHVKGSEKVVWNFCVPASGSWKMFSTSSS